MVDLLDAAVLVSGLEFWRGHERRPLSEPRLTRRLELLLGVQGLRLFAPPIGDEPGTGVPVFRFPCWFVTRYEDRRGPWRRRRLVRVRELDHALQFQAPDRTRWPVVPIRFVQGCPNGHLSDIEWHAFVHVEALASASSTCPRTLWIEERGTSGDLADVWITCECGQRRSMAQAKRGDAPLGFCRGRQPWLGDEVYEDCRNEHDRPLPNRLLLRSASDAYFSQVVSALALPDAGERLRRAIDSVWDDHLAYVENLAALTSERRRPRVAAALAGFEDAQVWDEMQRRRGQVAPVSVGLRQAEIETLLASPDETVAEAGGEPESEFYARRLVPARTLPAQEARLLAPLERIVLVHRLREVQTLVGFTRFEAAVADIDGELALDVRRAALARETRWLPAVENRGEGVFLALRQDALQAWLARPAVRTREQHLREGHTAWEGRHARALPAFPGASYVLLHSLAHLLITAVALECGYAASAIRERIYVTSAGAGLLLFTGTPDSEGTLGGLVQVGRRLGHYLRAALELARLCSHDPLCAQHRPDRVEEERFLHGAACHGCLLIAEPSCERRNEYLDRALVVDTVDTHGAAFFALQD
jgi:hypothetical protein